MKNKETQRVIKEALKLAEKDLEILMRVVKEKEIDEKEVKVEIKKTEDYLKDLYRKAEKIEEKSGPKQKSKSDKKDYINIY